MKKEEILARLEEIKATMSDDKKITNMSLDEIKEFENEQKELLNSLEKINTRERIENDLEGMAKGTVKPIRTGVVNFEEGAVAKEEPKDWQDMIATKDYENAWAKEMLGHKMTEAENNVLAGANRSYNNHFHTTENTGILVPKTVAAGIWQRAEEDHPLWNDVFKFRVPGELIITKGTPSEKAKWYDEETEVATDELEFAEITLKGHELAKAVKVSWKLEKMGVQEFQSYIVSEIGKRMGDALAQAVYEGSGTKEATGILTALEANAPEQIIETDELKYEDLTTMMSMLHSSYVSGAKIYTNNKTAWTKLATIVNGIGQPMFVPSPVADEGAGRILGQQIVLDDAIPEGVVMIGNLSEGYVANIHEDITMYNETNMLKRTHTYMGYANVDGTVKDESAFVILKVGEGTETP